MRKIDLLAALCLASSIVVLLLLLTSSKPCAPRRCQAVLRGQISFSDGRVGSGSLVQVFPMTHATPFLAGKEAIADSSGFYAFDDLESGNFLLRVLKADDSSTSEIAPTYFGGSSYWQSAETIVLACEDTLDCDIMAPVVSPATGDGAFGEILIELPPNYGDPIPGFPIIIEKDTTDDQIITGVDIMFPQPNSQAWSVENAPEGNFRVRVDIPGIDQASYHEVEFGSIPTSLDFETDLNSYILALALQPDNQLKTVAFPVPSEGPVTIFLPQSGCEEQLDVRIFGTNGKEVSFPVQIDGTTLKISPSRTAGAYTVVIGCGGITEKHRIIVR